MQVTHVDFIKRHQVYYPLSYSISFKTGEVSRDELKPMPKARKPRAKAKKGATNV